MVARLPRHHPRLSLALVLAALFPVARADVALPSDAAGSPAVQVEVQGEVAAAAVPAGDRQLPLPAACRGGQVSDPRWWDRAQSYFSQRACTPAVWFDRFFGDQRQEDVATALVRVIPSIQYSDRDLDDPGVSLKARFNLPNLEDRFNIVVNDDDVEAAGLLPGEVERPSQANQRELRDSSAALRYLVQLADRSGLDFDVGLRSEAKFFARGRYFRSWQLTPVVQTRFTQSAFFRDGEGFGEVSLLEVERLMSEDMLLRWSTQATVSEEVNGLELRDGIQLYRQLDADRAISWNLAMTVDSDPAWKANEYATSIRYRQRAFRSWFFYEVEPFLDWIREDNFNTNPGIALRLEFWLGDESEGNTGFIGPPPAASQVVPAVPENPYAAPAPALTSRTSDAPSAP